MVMEFGKPQVLVGLNHQRDERSCRLGPLREEKPSLGLREDGGGERGLALRGELRKWQ